MVLACAILVPVMAGLVVWQLLVPRSYYTGSNSTAVLSIPAFVNLHERLCVHELEIPAGTGAIRLAAFAQRGSVEARVSLATGGRTSSTVVRAPVDPASEEANLEARIPERPPAPATVPGTVCVVPLDGSIAFGGVSGLQAYQQPATLGHSKLEDRIAVWFLPPPGRKRSLLSMLGSISERAALFRPGIVGAWTYPVLLFAILPIIWLGAFLLLWRAAAGRPLTLRGRRVRTGLALGAIAFVNAGCWALITPAFQAPDEPSHFAYAQYLAETGHMPAKSPSSQPAFSTDQTLALDAVDLYSGVGQPDVRPPWSKGYERQWEALRKQVPHPRDDGGGYTEAASAHGPGYYALAAVPYLAASGQSDFSQLTVMRLLSALLGALVAFCAYGVVRELFPRQQLAAVAAGLLVAFQPMFGFISGAVNNDSGVNAAAALSLYLLIRALRRGLSWRVGLALGITLALAPLMKETGYELYPVAAVALACMIWRERARLRRPTRAVLAPWSALVAGFAGLTVGWLLLRPHILDTFGHNNGSAKAGSGGGLAATSALHAALHMPGRFLEYLWELFLPPLHFMTEMFPAGWPFFHVYVMSGWGAFGWDLVAFPMTVYKVIVIVMGVAGVLALWSAIRWRRALRGRWPELAVIILLPVCVLVAVEAVYFTPGPGRTAFAEQGRYIFPAIAALGVIAVGATFGLGRRMQVPLATALVVAMIALSYASQLLTLQHFYT